MSDGEEAYCGFQSVPLQECGLKQHALDGWDSARFLRLFWAVAASRFRACSSPAAGTLYRVLRTLHRHAVQVNAGRWAVACRLRRF